MPYLKCSCEGLQVADRQTVARQPVIQGVARVAEGVLRVHHFLGNGFAGLVAATV